MRDFFYNKGDVLIAVLIILVAAFVIYLRIGVIMDYDPLGIGSSGLFSHSGQTGQTGQTGQPEQPQTDPAQEQPPADTDGAPDGAAQQQQQPDGALQNTEDQKPQQQQPTQNPEDQPTQPPAQQPTTGQSGQPLQITVNAGDAASTIADKLYATGAISDKQAFLADVIAQGADSKLKIGTFTIPAGASHADIIAILIK